MSHRKTLDERLLTGAVPNGAHFAERHRDAVLWPRGIEKPLLAMVRALADYADEHDSLQARAGTDHRLGDDGVIGDDYWAGIARGVIYLFNGDHGRLDAGAVDSAIRAMAKDIGIDSPHFR